MVKNSCRSCVLATSILLLCCPPAFAGGNEASVSTAREIAKEGLAAYDAGRYGEANEKLSRALEVVGVPTLALYTARSNVRLGKLVRASELYLLATRLDPKGPSESVQIQAQRDAANERGELLPRIPRLTIILEGEDLGGTEVFLDSQPVPKALLGTPQLVDPGHRKVAAKRGDEEVSAEVDVAEKEHKTTTMRFLARDTGAAAISVPVLETKTEPVALGNGNKPLSSDRGSGPKKTQRTLGWIGVGVGGAGLAFGAVVGGLALGKRGSLRDAGCNENNACFNDQRDDVDRYNGMRTMSMVGFLAGGVIAAAGITLLITGSESKSTTTGLVLRPNAFAFVGGF